jgi:cytochrome c peroxidase
MIKRSALLVLLSFLSLATFNACDEKSNQPDEIPNFQTTPYDFNLPDHFFDVSFPEGNPLTNEGVELGRHLFYEKKLSRDNSQSCGSCHNQKLAFTDNGRKFSIGITGAIGRRNSMPLFNLFYHKQGLFWDGRSLTLHEQALEPIIDPTEMNETLDNVVKKLSEESLYRELFMKAFGSEEVTAEKIGLALEQFMFSIKSTDSKWDRVQRGEDEFNLLEMQGEALFNAELSPVPGFAAGDCFHCHGGPDFSNHRFFNNGLDTVWTDIGRYEVTGDQSDIGKFKSPSLRNVELTAPYMHDGRFATLEEVLEHYDEHVKAAPNLDPNLFASIGKLNLGEEERTAIIAFLKTLTDTVFINNPKYSNPFEE